MWKDIFSARKTLFILEKMLKCKRKSMIKIKKVHLKLRKVSVNRKINCEDCGKTFWEFKNSRETHIKIWKMFRRENFCGGSQKDFFHSRESVERLLFLLKIKYISCLASSKWSKLFSLTIEVEVHHFIFFLRRQNGVKYINKDVRVS